MNVLDLFSGIGGFSLGLERAGMKTVAFCEIEPFCRKVLKKHWPDVPIFEDVRTLHATDITEPIDLICGGYPCQPFSCAGKRRGAEDDRHLWPEYLRLIREIHPRWVIAENVAGHINMGLDQVLTDLENEGYSWWTFIIPACAVDAPHRRDRLWIVGNSERSGLSGNTRRRAGSKPENRHQTMADSKGQPERPRLCEGKSGEERRRRSGDSGSEAAANTMLSGLEKLNAPCLAARQGQHAGLSVVERRGARWPTEPAVGRVAYGIPSRVDRLRGLGNAVVPQIPEIIGRAIMQI